MWTSRSEEHTSELQSLRHLVCRLLLEKNITAQITHSTCLMLCWSGIHPGHTVIHMTRCPAGAVLTPNLRGGVSRSDLFFNVTGRPRDLPSFPPRRSPN